MQVILLSRSIGPTWGLLVYHPIVSPSQCWNPDSQMLPMVLVCGYLQKNGLKCMVHGKYTIYIEHIMGFGIYHNFTDSRVPQEWGTTLRPWVCQTQVGASDGALSRRGCSGRFMADISEDVASLEMCMKAFSDVKKSKNGFVYTYRLFDVLLWMLLLLV